VTHPRLHLASFCLIGLSLVGCATQPAQPTLPVAQTSSPAVVALPAEGFVRDWVTNLPLDGSTLIEIHLRDDAVFAYDAKHNAYLIDRTSGQLISIAPVTGANNALRPPVVLGDRIIYPTTSTLEVFNRQGRRLRSIDLGFAIRSDATGASTNTVYVGSDYGNGGRLSAIDLDKDFGFLKWELTTFGGVSGKPIVVQNVTYVGGEDGRVYAVNPDRGATWTLDRGAFETNGPIYADMAGDDYGIYVASFDGKLYCLDRLSGKIKWMWYSSSPLKHTPYATTNTVYQQTDKDGLVAIDKTSGEYVRKARWTAPDVKQFLAEDEKRTYVLKNDNSIAALDKATGEELFVNTRNDFVAFAPNNKTAVLYAATASGQVLAVKPILRPGLTGELVMVPVNEPIALAR